MSIIYDSLQKLKRKQISTQLPTQGQKSKTTANKFGPYLRATLYVIIFMGLLLILVFAERYFLKRTLSNIETKEIQKNVSTQELKAKLEQKEVPGSNQSSMPDNQFQLKQEENQSMGEHIKALEDKVQSMALSNNSPTPISKDKNLSTKQTDQQKNTFQKQNINQKLLSKFRFRAKKNQQILELENHLKASLKNGDSAQAQKIIKELSNILNKNHFLINKWQGVLALQKKNYSQAESYFRPIWEKHTNNLKTGINLALSLLGQRKYDQARQIYVQLQKEFPHDPMLEKLAFLSHDSPQ
jgi:predicted Zn-dependent protease